MHCLKQVLAESKQMGRICNCKNRFHPPNRQNVNLVFVTPSVSVNVNTCFFCVKLSQ